MRRDPILASTILPADRYYKVARSVTVNGGLHYLKGNATPYFSITVDVHRKGFPNQCQSGGADHELIEQKFPGKFTDLIALHLCDIDGAPTHAEANGWYKLAGALGGAGERYHAGNAEYRFPVTPPEGQPWKTTESRKPTASECLDMFARHCRISRAEAEAIRERVAAKWNYPDMRVEWAAICETMKPRWKAEAEACIAKHGLVVFGDKWENQRHG